MIEVMQSIGSCVGDPGPVLETVLAIVCCVALAVGLIAVGAAIRELAS